MIFLLGLKSWSSSGEYSRRLKGGSEVTEAVVGTGEGERSSSSDREARSQSLASPPGLVFVANSCVKEISSLDLSNPDLRLGAGETGGLTPGADLMAPKLGLRMGTKLLRGMTGAVW